MVRHWYRLPTAAVVIINLSVFKKHLDLAFRNMAWILDDPIWSHELDSYGSLPAQGILWCYSMIGLAKMMPDFQNFRFCWRSCWKLHRKPVLHDISYLCHWTLECYYTVYISDFLHIIIFISFNTTVTDNKRPIWRIKIVFTDILVTITF